jgi:large subunit ribosomal protein L16
MLFPKKTKYRKHFKNKLRGNEYKVTNLTMGYLGIKVLKSARIKATQLEATRKAILKKLKGKSKIWVIVFPHVCVTAKPTEVRMGKGKGSFSYWCAPVHAGRIIFELQERSFDVGYKILKIVTDKLGIPARLVSR